jgi:hypothetical protein
MALNFRPPRIMGDFAMSKNQDVIACFKHAFETNQGGNEPVLGATLASYNMSVPQVLLILNMTRDCLAGKDWHYTVPSTIDTTETIQLLIASIMNSTTPMPAMAGFALRASRPKKKTAPKTANKGKAKKRKGR